MFLILRHAQYWAAAVAKYKIEDVEAPTSFPVLVSIDQNEDGEAMDGVVLIYPSQAAKLLSVCTPETIMSIPEGTRKAVETAFGISFSTKKDPTSKPLLKIPLASIINESKKVVAVSADGSSFFYNTSGGDSGFKLGDKITVSGKEYSITQIGESLAAMDPITDEEGIIEVKDEEVLTPGVPGLESVPMDPSKLEEKHKIADLGDPTAHVLDVERDV